MDDSNTIIAFIVKHSRDCETGVLELVSLFLVSGHAHLTDFNIATILEPGQLATSMSGTKPYMGKPYATNTVITF